MKRLVSNVAIAGLLGFLLNAPFVIGELLTRDVTGLRTDFPWTLFIGLWIEAGLFMYLLTLIIRACKNGTASKKPVLLSTQVFILGILAWAWITLIIDQWPCFFLGGSGC